jgi:hypothetical protein
MIVFDDSEFRERLLVLVDQIRVRISALRTTTASNDDIRRLLVCAGQLEQAISDSDNRSKSAVDLFMRITDCAAKALLHVQPLGPTLAEMSALLLNLPENIPSHDLNVRIPEGFAFYALFPEQYARAALLWSQQNQRAKSAGILVAGVRSIGTTLSAVVKCVLTQVGFDVKRITVRPEGHPYWRKCSIPPGEIGNAGCALVVDEGPGLSGSSMCSVFEALVAAGFRRDSISFLPSHNGNPGNSATHTVRTTWSVVSKFVAAPSEPLFGGCSLVETLAKTSADLFGAQNSQLCVEDLGAGAWRANLYADPSEWPTCCVLFERPKYRCVLPDGRSIFWKFFGHSLIHGGESLDSSVIGRPSQERTKRWTLAPVGCAMGFVAWPWIEGTPLCQADLRPKLLEEIGSYIFSVANDPLSVQECLQACRRLSKMMKCNVTEAFGPDYLQHSDQQELEIEQWVVRLLPRAAGDGRLAPHEWLRTRAGELLKTDASGHEIDHTIVGRQPIYWDIAGACVEWSLNEQSMLPLISTIESHGIIVPAAILEFYCEAYAAFRIGICTVCAQTIGDSAELGRLNASIQYYKRWLIQSQPLTAIPKS